MDKEELSILVSKLIASQSDFIQKNGKHSFGKLMGILMEQVRGKIDGKIVNDELANQLALKLKESGLEE